MRNFGRSRHALSLGDSSMPSGSKRTDSVTPSVDNVLPAGQLPFVLSIVAGSVDVIGFLALDGLFAAHITGNIVVLAARLVAGEDASLSHLLAVPAFMLVLALTRILAALLERARIASLLPLLLLELLLLIGFFILGFVAGPSINPNAAPIVLAGMLGISAMAVQNALVRISLTGAPSTAVMTTNVTVFTIDLGEILLAQDPGRAVKARDRARSTGSAIAGFIVGCALGAACQHIVGLRSLALPISFLLTAIALGHATARRQSSSRT
jgi:uncharacterized membrane protein YoaK (UPF0700 family)